MRFLFKRVPIRGVGWMVAVAPIGGFVLILRPAFVFQFLGMNDKFAPPEWIRWRIK